MRGRHAMDEAAEAARRLEGQRRADETYVDADEYEAPSFTEEEHSFARQLQQSAGVVGDGMIEKIERRQKK